MKRALNCLWLLGNADESILKLNTILDHGFEVREIDIRDEDFKIIQKLERLDDAGISNRLSLDYHCMTYTKLYCIQNVFDVPFDDFQVRFDKISTLDKKLIDDYVPSFVSKMRLFKEGNLNIPVSYKYFMNENREPHLYTQQTWLKSEFSINFKLEDSELESLKEFMKDLVMPFRFGKNFLQDAFELFEMSYYTFNDDIKAMILFMSMEIMFKSGKKCNSHCISENVASFFANDYNQFENMFGETKNYWHIRNNIVHEGSAGINRQKLKELIKKLREYVRNSIVKMDKTGQDKKAITETIQNKSNNVH